MRSPTRETSMRELVIATCATALITFAASTSAAAPPGSTPDARHAALERIMHEELDDVRSNMRELCEPHCGGVWLEPSLETATAATQAAGDGISQITYDESFMTGVIGKYGRSVAYAIMAHEYGHHLDVKPAASRPVGELRADAVAGCALARRADSLDPALRWLRDEHFVAVMHDVFADASDPAEVVRSFTQSKLSWLDRIAALKTGAKLCSTADGPPTVAALFRRVPSD